jgi:stringent starvation protein B
MTPAGQDTPSTRPYLIRALYEWCTENGFSPYLAVQVDASVRVPMDHVKNGEIVLNISFDATSSMQLGNEFIEFKARFGGVAREIVIPVSHVTAIYARENGQGMAFPAPTVQPSATSSAHAGASSTRNEPAVPPLAPVSGGAQGQAPEPRTPSRGKLIRVK